jgi:hypothetical protein
MFRALHRLAGATFRHWSLVLAACLVVILAVASLRLLNWCTGDGTVSVPGAQSEQVLPALAAPLQPNSSWTSWTRAPKCRWGKPALRPRVSRLAASSLLAPMCSMAAGSVLRDGPGAAEHGRPIPVTIRRRSAQC